MTPVLAHVAGWHILIYLSPVFFVGGGLWVAGRYMPDEEDLEFDFEDDEFDTTTGAPR